MSRTIIIMTKEGLPARSSGRSEVDRLMQSMVPRKRVNTMRKATKMFSVFVLAGIGQENDR